MSVNIIDICDDVKDTLATATGIVRAESVGDLTEDFPDLPLLMVYPFSGEVDSFAESSERTTFRGGVRTAETLIYVDIPCRQRSHIDEDMKKTVEIIDAVTTKLEAQRTKPYFANSSIKGFRWRWERVNFSRGDPEISYVGVRFFIWVITF